MGTDNDPRILIILLAMSLIVTALAVVGLVLLGLRPTDTPLPTQQAVISPTATLVPRQLEVEPPPAPRGTSILVESKSSQSITAQQTVAASTPVILEPVYGDQQ